MKKSLGILAGAVACIFLALGSNVWGKPVELSSYTQKIVHDVQQSLLASIQNEKDTEASFPVDVEQDDYPLSEETRQHLASISGPDVHDFGRAEWGKSLAGPSTASQKIALREVVLEAAAHNLDGRIASLLPASRETEVTEAAAAFDWESFSSLSYKKTNTPQPVETINGIPVDVGQIKQEKAEAGTGLRRKLEFGGSMEVATGLSRLNDQNPQREYLPDPAILPEGTLSLTLPLLRNSGFTVNQSKIVWAENVKARDRCEAIQALSQAVLDTETAYWELSYAHYRLAVAENLLKQAQETYDALKARTKVDAKPMQLAQAWNDVLSRRDELLQAQLAVRDNTDKLKELMNSPSHPLLGETVLVPVDRPRFLPPDLQLDNTVRTALKHNPKIEAAMMDLENSRLQWQVADLQRRPQLDLKLEGGVYGMGENTSRAYQDMEDARYAGGAAMVVFSVPLGNRAADAVYERSRLAKKSRELEYTKTAREVARLTKGALRESHLAVRAVATCRERRIAAAEHFRTLTVREKEMESLTTEFLLHQKPEAQRGLAEAEIREYQALAHYHTSLAKLHHQCGDLLMQYGVEVGE